MKVELEERCCYCKNKEGEVGTFNAFYDANSGRWICSNCIGLFGFIGIENYVKEFREEFPGFEDSYYFQKGMMKWLKKIEEKCAWHKWTNELMEEQNIGN